MMLHGSSDPSGTGGALIEDRLKGVYGFMAPCYAYRFVKQLLMAVWRRWG